MEEQNLSLDIQEQGQLKRNLSLFEATVFGISYVIGTGVFLKPSVVLENAGSTGMALLVWVFAGLISLCAALTIAEIAAYIPKLGGLYTYLSELYGEAVGFLYGWVISLVAGPAGCAASAIAFATFASYFVPLSDAMMPILSIAMVIFFTFLQIYSTKGAMKAQVIGTIGKLLPIVAIVGVGLFRGEIPGAVNMSLVGTERNLAISAALVGALYAYDGWVSTCTLGAELVDSEKNLPKAIIMALVFVIAVYAVFNYIIFKNIPPEQVIASENTGVAVAEKLFGRGGATLISFGLLISSAVTMNAQMMNNVRYVLPMAQRKLIPGHKVLSYIHPKFDTPIFSIILEGILVLLFIMVGNFEMLTNMEIFIVWLFFTLTVFGIFILRKNYERKDNLYSTPLYPIIPILGIVGGGYLVISTLFGMFKLSMLGLGGTFIGLPVFFYYKNKR